MEFKGCAKWRDIHDLPFYAQGVRREGNRLEPRKRGPKPVISDLELLGHIRRDLEQSPFHGEGHRKVWGRLKFGQGLRISRKRVLRLMREHHPLSPYRRPQGNPKLHTGEIITNAPNIMWGTDATKVFTAEDGYAWAFAAVEHWNAECVGWHVCKRGDRYAAMEPVLMGLNEHFGSLKAEIGRGLSLRMDHGPQYLSEHFQNQLRYWGDYPEFCLPGGASDQRGYRAVLSHPQGTGHLRNSLSKHPETQRSGGDIHSSVQQPMAS